MVNLSYDEGLHILDVRYGQIERIHGNWNRRKPAILKHPLNFLKFDPSIISINGSINEFSITVGIRKDDQIHSLANS